MWGWRPRWLKSPGLPQVSNWSSPLLLVLSFFNGLLRTGRRGELTLLHCAQDLNFKELLVLLFLFEPEWLQTQSKARSNGWGCWACKALPVFLGKIKGSFHQHGSIENDGFSCSKSVSHWCWQWSIILRAPQMQPARLFPWAVFNFISCYAHLSSRSLHESKTHTEVCPSLYIQQ